MSDLTSKLRKLAETGTLEQLAEEYVYQESNWQENIYGDKCGIPPADQAPSSITDNLALAYLAGAKAALSLPEVRVMREACDDYCAEIKHIHGNCSAEYSRMQNIVAAFNRLLEGVE